MYLASSSGMDGFIFNDYLREQVEYVNRNLLDFIRVNAQAGRLPYHVAGITEQQLTTLHLPSLSSEKQRILRTPVLCFRPIVSTAREFALLFDEGSQLSHRLQSIANATPNYPSNNEAAIRVRYENKRYLEMLKTVLAVNHTAAPMLGLSTEIAEMIKAMSLVKLHAGTSKWHFPLFEWRYQGDSFWHAVTTNRLSEEALAHFIMQTCFDRETPTHPPKTNKRIGKFLQELYSEAMIRMGARPSTINALFLVPTNIAKRRYTEVHGKAATTGKIPTGNAYYTQSPAHRVQSSTFVWLYRHGLRSSENVYEATISAANKCSLLFTVNPLLHCDRAAVLAQTFLKFQNLHLAPCRKCRTPYVLQSSGDKIELQDFFKCPCCTNMLKYSSDAGSVKKRRRSRVSAGVED